MKASVINSANRAALQAISNDVITELQTELVSHEAVGNTAAHIISNISGLQTALNSKQNLLNGYTGNITVVTDVNFSGQSTTTKTITVNNGIITSIV